MNQGVLEQDLKTVAGERVFFGHQSVGDNIIDGLRDLSAAAGGGRLNIVDLSKSQPSSGPFLAEVRIGKNGSPSSKCEAFARNVGELLGDSLDIAVMKFCYVDFEPATNVDSVFARYRTTIEEIRKQAPGLTIVHATVPLTVSTPGWKRFIKKIVGREESSDLLNAKRQQYNELLRRAYERELIFDIAAVESTYPDGAREQFTRDGATAYALIPQLSDDGAHLNRKGREVAAREFLRTLAQAAGRRVDS